VGGGSVGRRPKRRSFSVEETFDVVVLDGRVVNALAQIPNHLTGIWVEFQHNSSAKSSGANKKKLIMPCPAETISGEARARAHTHTERERDRQTDKTH